MCRFRIHLISMRIYSHRHGSRSWTFLTKEKFSNCSFPFFVIFMLMLDKPFREKESFQNISFFNGSDLGFALVDIFPLGADPWIHIFLQFRRKNIWIRIRGSTYFCRVPMEKYMDPDLWIHIFLQSSNGKMTLGQRKI